MGDLEFGNLEGKAEREVVLALRRLREAVSTNARQLSGIPVPLTPNQILDLVRSGLQSTGSHPIDLTGLAFGPNSVGAISEGTHAQRLATTAAAGNWFFETDRTALYAAITPLGSVPTWILMAGNQGGSDAAKHGDLGLNDEGYIWFSQDRGTILRWTGAAWRWESGTYTDVYANIPNPATVTAATGVYFSASDRGYQVWRYDRAGLKWDFVGGGIPTKGTLANLTAGLGANDVGYLYYATDFDRTYVWTGAAYADAPGQPSRDMVAFFNVAPGVGWHLCDGTPNVPVSTAVGGTLNTNMPNLTGGGNVYLAAGPAVAGPGTFGAVGVVYADMTFLPYYRL